MSSYSPLWNVKCLLLFDLKPSLQKILLKGGGAMVVLNTVPVKQIQSLSFPCTLPSAENRTLTKQEPEQIFLMSQYSWIGTGVLSRASQQKYKLSAKILEVKLSN